MDYLVVDGYNVIGSWPELQALRHKAMASAREQLIEILAEYRAFTGQQVIVVFDAYRSKGEVEEQVAPGLHIIFTRQGQTADSLIEAMVSEMSGRHQVAVVTSDWAQQQIVLGKGARRWSSREFLSEVTRVRGLIADSARRTRQKKISSALSTRINKKTREILEQMGKNTNKP